MNIASDDLLKKVVMERNNYLKNNREILIFLIFACTWWLSSTKASTELETQQLPDDTFKQLQIVHELKYPFAGKSRIATGFNYLYGEKFASTYAWVLSYTYYWSEVWALRASYFNVKSSVTDEAQEVQQLGGKTPIVYAPDYMVRLSALYKLIYGKLIIGERINRFSIAIEVGANMAQEKLMTTPATIPAGSKERKIGPVIGLEILFPLSPYLDISFNTHYFTHKRPFAQEGKWISYWGNMISVGYRF